MAHQTLTQGQAATDPTTGIAGAIFAYVLANAAASGMSAAAFTPGTPARNALAVICEAVASGIVAQVNSGVAFTPETPANWSTNPTTVAEALDELAARLAAHGI